MQFLTPVLINMVFLLLPHDAHAYDFGFVRAPDWMDPYVLGLIILLLPFFIGAYLTKPKDVPFNQLYKTKLDPRPAFFYRCTLVLFSLLMLVVFVGMGLARM